VTKTDLPRETSRESLDYNRVISTLDMIDGEFVVVTLIPRGADRDATPGAASIIGELRHQVAARYEGHEFSIGSPYPDRSPEHLAGGILYINEGTFESAALTTFDGNDYFAVSIRTRSMEILVQDDGSGYP
jgi:hypothetical protein